MDDSRDGALRGLAIMVVDDDPDSRQILSAVLGYFGAYVLLWHGVNDALTRLAQSRSPPAILRTRSSSARDSPRISRSR